MSAIKVPEGMLKAAELEKQLDSEFRLSSQFTAFGDGMRFACRWLSENPFVPTEEQVKQMNQMWHSSAIADSRPEYYEQFIAAEWQRRMFLAPDPDEPIPCVNCGEIGMTGRMFDKTRCVPCYNLAKDRQRGREGK